MMSAEVMNKAAIILAISAFLFIATKGESAHILTVIKRHMTFPLSEKYFKKLWDLYSNHAQDGISYLYYMAKIEKQLALHKFIKSGISGYTKVIAILYFQQTKDR